MGYRRTRRRQYSEDVAYQAQRRPPIAPPPPPYELTESQPEPDAGASINQPVYRGWVRSFNEQRGFGFIESLEALRTFGHDVFLHRAQMEEADVTTGQAVEFEVAFNSRSQPQARNLRLLPNDVRLPGDPLGTFEDQVKSKDDSKSKEGSKSKDDSNNNDHSTPRTSSASTTATGGSSCSPPSRTRTTSDLSSAASTTGAGKPKSENIELLEQAVRRCCCCEEMWSLVNQYGNMFGKRHAIIALYLLGTYRQKRERWSMPLTATILSKLFCFPPWHFTACEATCILWSLATLDETHCDTGAHAVAMGLGEEGLRRFHEFKPAQMATFVSSLSRLVWRASEDELVGRVTKTFSEFASGCGSVPRFSPQELQDWTGFLWRAAFASDV